MCGILGSLNLPFAEDTLDLLRHRGPNDAGVSHAHVGFYDLFLVTWSPETGPEIG
jgi:asparagine synthetase B (glutamine-hydrolysing)